GFVAVFLAASLLIIYGWLSHFSGFIPRAFSSWLWQGILEVRDILLSHSVLTESWTNIQGVVQPTIAPALPWIVLGLVAGTLLYFPRRPSPGRDVPPVVAHVSRTLSKHSSASPEQERSELAAALRSCRRAFLSVALFSGVSNILMLTGAFFML